MITFIWAAPGNKKANWSLGFIKTPHIKLVYHHYLCKRLKLIRPELDIIILEIIRESPCRKLHLVMGNRQI